MNILNCAGESDIPQLTLLPTLKKHDNKLVHITAANNLLDQFINDRVIQSGFATLFIM